jgi:hypothetical protein
MQPKRRVSPTTVGGIVAGVVSAVSAVAVAATSSGWLGRQDWLDTATSVGAVAVAAAAGLGAARQLRWGVSRLGRRESVAAVNRVARLAREALRAELNRLSVDRDRVVTTWSVQPQLEDLTVPDTQFRERAFSGTSAGTSNLLERIATGRLCILGAPGSGKTTLALTIARDWLEQPGQEDRIPLVVTLSGWNPFTERFENWLARHLAEQFPETRARTPTETIAERIVASGRLLPILDGFDELPAPMQAAALGRLNHAAGRPFILTSRTAEFAAAPGGGRVRGAVVIELQPLDPSSLIQFLTTDDRRLGRWRPIEEELRDHPDGLLAAVLSTPWTAFAMRAAYADPATDPVELLDRAAYPTAADIESSLLDTWLATVERHIGRFATVPAPTIRRWFSTIAVHLTALKRREFTWWRLPLALGGGAMNAVVIGCLSVGALVGSTVSGYFNSVPAFVYTCTFVMLVGPGNFHSALPPRRLARPTVVRGATAVLAGLGVGALPLVVEGLFRAAGAPEPSIARTVVLVGLGGLAGLAWAWTARTDKAASAAPDSMTKDIAATVTRAAAVSALFAAVYRPEPAAALGRSILAELSVGLAAYVVTFVVDSSWMRFTLARLWLALRGQLPWRLTAFLRSAEQAGVLRSSGGQYEFRHPSLQDRLNRRHVLNTTWVEPGVMDAIEREVLTLPEVALQLADAADDATRAQLIDRVRRIVRQNPDEVRDSGASDWNRYEQARDRLLRSAAGPRWAHAAQIYGQLTLVAAGLGVLGAALIRFGSVVFFVFTSLATAALIVALARTRSRRGLGASVHRRSVIPFVTVAYLLIATLTAVSFDPHLREERWLPIVTLACFAALLVVGVPWLLSRPYRAMVMRLSRSHPPQWATLPRLGYDHTAAEQAWYDWIATLARDGVMPHLRPTLRSHLDPFTTALTPLDPSRLGGVSRLDQLVETAAAGQVDWLLRHLNSASIGISGSRGAGKSTMLLRFSDAQLTRESGDLRVLVPAPTAYDRREFLVHLFTEVCEQIVSDTTPDDTPGPRVRRRRWWGPLPALAVVSGLVAVILANRWTEAHRVMGWFPAHVRLLVTSAGGACIAAGVVAAILIALRTKIGSRDDIEDLARAQLRRLRYQLTTSATTTGKIGIPGGSEVGASGSVQRTEQLRSYPELVADFRDLLEKVAADKRDKGGRVILGIDELDKIDTAADAERFLNDLKVIFGVNNCYFLVAVSEDALSAFDRRALAVRTTFDSAFDTIVAAPPLDVEQARRLLELRGIALPEPFLWLCYLLSGGVPRDLLRTVIGLATANRTEASSDLAQLARTMLRNDVRSVIEAQIRLADAAADPGSPLVAAWLGQAAQEPTSAATLERLADDPPTLSSKSTLQPLLEQAIAYLYYTATLVRTFVDQPKQMIAWLRQEGGDSWLNGLGRSRSRLPTGGRLVIGAIDRFRTGGAMPTRPLTPTPNETSVDLNTSIR